MTSNLARPPILFLSHGAPPLADDATWTRELNDWAGTFDKHKDVLMVSPHWENAPVTLSATGRNPGLVGRAALEELTERWDRRCGAIVRLWENAWGKFIPFLDYDVENRRVICSTNAYESLNAR